MAGATGLDITPAATVDPTKAPENANVHVRTDTGGRSQVRVQFTPAPSVDPADPKPEKTADKPAQGDSPAQAKVEDKPAAAETPTQRPQWLPEKFATPQALKDATVELAKKQGLPGYVIAGLLASESGQEVSDAYKSFEKQIDPNAGKPAEKVEEKPPVAEEKPKEEPAVETPLVKDEATKAYERETYGDYVAEMLDKVGIRAVDMGEEFAKNGNKLTEATYAKFAKAGVAKGFLDAYVAGVVGQATQLAETHIREIKSEVFGGEDGFTTVAVWAQANMSKDQHELYSTMTNSGSRVAAAEAARMLKGWYDKANGKPPVARVVPDTTPAVPENKGYGSRQEMIADMGSARYKSGDKAFHKMVEEKLKHTNL